MKKLLILLTALSIGSIDAMGWFRKPVQPVAANPMSQHQNEVAFSTALKNGAVEKIKELIEQEKVDVNKPLTIVYGGRTPLEVIFEQDVPNKIEIAQVLLTAGAADIDGKAKAAIESAKGKLTELAVAAYEKAMKELEAKEKEANAPFIEEFIEEKKEPLEVVLESEQEERITPVTYTPIVHYPTKFQQLVPRAEQPVRPVPVTKPAAAQPRVQEVKVEVVPVAKPAAQEPMRLVPVTKPAVVAPAASAQERVLMWTVLPEINIHEAELEAASVPQAPIARQPVRLVPVTKPAAAQPK